MQLHIEQISKKYQQNWLFKNIDLQINKGEKWAITGKNGSGKSTLIKIIAGYTIPDSGKVQLDLDGLKINENQIFKHLSIVAPYQDLLENFSIIEHLAFHFKFKERQTNVSLKKLCLQAGLHSKDLSKEIKYFSSGMKQRLKLIMAFESKTPLLLLDEPTSFLDDEGVNWFNQQIISVIQSNRIILVASNDKNEYAFADNIFNIQQ